MLELLPEELSYLELFPCGRLDRDTVGLMLITDDGELAHFLLSPVSHVSKAYRFRCESELDENGVNSLTSGVDIGDEKITKPSSLTLDEGKKSGVIVLSEGRYHQIKRMFGAVGNRITYLERISFGPLELDASLERGQWRYLENAEIEALQHHNRNKK